MNYAHPSMMGSYCFVILSLLFPFSCDINAQTSSCNNNPISTSKTLGRNHEWRLQETIEPQNNDTSIRGVENYVAATTSNLGSWKGQSNASHRGRHFRNVHGILNIIGWGAFFPIGVIVARYFRKVPLKCEEWYNLHVLCQTSGYIIGAIGWGVGLWLGNNSSKQHTLSLKTHRILSIIIFTFATVQMLALCLQPKRDDDYRSRYWGIYHQILGYALIAIIIANIFEGIQNQAHPQKWIWFYVGLLVILGCVAIALEVYRWVKPSRSHQQQMPFEINFDIPT